MTTMLRTIVAISLVIFLAGCTIMSIQRENSDREKTIEEKQQRLQSLDEQNDKLQEENNILKSQLQVELQQLAAKLNHIKSAENSIAKETSDSILQRQRLADLDNRLNQLKSDLANGTGGQNQKMLADKKKQIADLRQEIEAYLRLGIN